MITDITDTTVASLTEIDEAELADELRITTGWLATLAGEITIEARIGRAGRVAELESFARAWQDWRKAILAEQARRVA